MPGERVGVEVRLEVTSTQVAGVQNDLTWDGAAVGIAAGSDGRPDCVVNPAINKAASGFAFLPSGCRATACTGMRALIVAADNVDAIADGSLLYTCEVDVAADAAAGLYRIDVNHVVMSTRNGFPVHGVLGAASVVAVGAPP